MAKGFIIELEEKPVLAGSGTKQYYVGPNPSEAGAGRGKVNPEAVVPRNANSRAQYEHEKAVGDPSARDLSYEEWKKL